MRRSISSGREVLLLGLGAFALMTGFESLKEYVFQGMLTHWESHLMTIVVTTVISVIASAVVKSWMIAAQAEIRLGAIAFDSQESFLITDANGYIVRVNRAFTESTGYQASEVIGKSPSILKSGRHTSSFYEQMWSTIRTEGKWCGEVWDRRKNGEILPRYLRVTAIKNLKGLVTHYVGSHVDISIGSSESERVSHLLYFDPVTGLPNRTLLSDRFESELVQIEGDINGAILLVDIDNFIDLNSILGRARCDVLLLQIAKRLREIDTVPFIVSRTGGDEFVLLFINLNQSVAEAHAQIESIARQLHKLFKEPFTLESQPIWIQLSIGVSMFNKKIHFESLFKQAELAMYHAKQEGKNCHRFYRDEILNERNSRSIIESDLRLALGNHQLELHYQIQVNDHNCPIGAEALLRWRHPQRGMISPAEFIPIAENCELIIPIGRWVVEAAIEQLVAWQQQATTRDLVLAINVSSKQFCQADFSHHIKSTLLRHNVNPKLLKLELTEGILVNDFDDVLNKMQILKRIGVQFSLDDFGTGYSSLQYLRRLPLDQIKIDQSFVRHLEDSDDDRTIVSTVISMALNLHLEVIAEGVETDEQRNILITKGCINFQGYLFSKPLPVEQFDLLCVRLAINTNQN